MAVPLGAFTQGLFGGMNSVLSAYGMMQEIQQRGLQMEGAAKLKAAEEERLANDQKARENPTPLIQTTEPATPASTTPAQTQTQTRTTPADLSTVEAAGQGVRTDADQRAAGVPTTPPATQAGTPAGMPTPPIPPAQIPGAAPPTTPTPGSMELAQPGYPPPNSPPAQYAAAPYGPHGGPPQGLPPGRDPSNPPRTEAYGPPTQRAIGPDLSRVTNEPPGGNLSRWWNGLSPAPAAQAAPVQGPPQAPPPAPPAAPAAPAAQAWPPNAGAQGRSAPAPQPPPPTEPSPSRFQTLGQSPQVAPPAIGMPSMPNVTLPGPLVQPGAPPGVRPSEPPPPTAIGSPGYPGSLPSMPSSPLPAPRPQPSSLDPAGRAPSSGGEASLGGRIMGALGALNPIPSANAQSAPTAPGPPIVQGGAPGAAPAPTPGGAPGAAPGAGAPPAPGGINTAASTVEPPQAPPPAQVAKAEAGTAPAQPGPVASNTAVAPGQKGPSAASEAGPTVPRMDVRPYQWLAKNAPKDLELVERIAQEEGISPMRLALHWYIESGMRHVSPDSRSGARGVMQVLEGTQREVDPQGRLNHQNYEDSLRMGARYIAKMDGKFGQDTPSSFYAYMRGPGGAMRIANDINMERQVHSDGVKALEAAFPGAKWAENSFVKGGNMTAQGIIQAAEQGPSGMMQYFATNGPKNLGMTDTMRQAEIALVVAAAAKGDWNGVQHARNFMLQLSQQGASSNLMAAHQAASAGNMTAAATYLARSHAFFPDGTMGRFGVDSKGQLWGQQFDERDPSKPIGGHFQITPDTISNLLIQTRDPNAYVKLVQEQQKNASESRYRDALGSYYREKHGVDLTVAKMTQDTSRANNFDTNQTSLTNNQNTVAAGIENNRNTNATSTANTEAQIAAQKDIAKLRVEDVLAQRQATADQQLRTEIDRALTDNTDIATTLQPMHREILPKIAFDMMKEPGNNRPPTTSAIAVAAKVAKGEYTVTRSRDGQPIIADPKRGENGFVAYISPQMAEGIAKMQRDPLAGKPKGVGGTAQSSAVPARAN